MAGGVLSRDRLSAYRPRRCREYFFWRWRCSFSVCPPTGARQQRADESMVDAFAPTALSRLFSPQLMAVEPQPTVPRPAGGDQRSGGPRGITARRSLCYSLAVDYHPSSSSRPLRPANGRHVRILPSGLSAAVTALCQRGGIRRRPTAEGWLRLMPAAGFVTRLLTLGQMLLNCPRPGYDPAVRRGVGAGRPLAGARHRRRVRGVLAGYCSVICLTRRSFPRRRRFIPGFCWRCFRCAAPSPCGQSVARWRQHDAERATARSGSEPTIKYIAWGR